MTDDQRYSPEGRALGAMLRADRYRERAISDILDALEDAGWNQAEAARQLGVGWSTLKRWIGDHSELRRAVDRGRR